MLHDRSPTLAPGADPRGLVVLWALVGQFAALGATLTAVPAVVGMDLPAAPSIALMVASAVSLASWRLGRRRLAAWGAVGVAVAAVVLFAMIGGGLDSFALYGVGAPPVLASLVLGWRGSIVAATATLLGVRAASWAQHAGWDVGTAPPREAVWIALVSVSLFVVVMSSLTDVLGTAALARAESAAAERGDQITRRIATEAQLQDALEGARAASRAKTEFLASMSHELRTPLNAIIGYAELLSDEPACAGPATRDDLRRIQSAGRHLLSLINDVLDVSRIEAGRMQVSFEDVDVGALVEELVETARPLVERNRNEFVVHVPSQAGRMTTDSVRAAQVVFNLLSNAAKFTTDGTVTLEVAHTLFEDQAAIRFRVTDTGIGIPADVLPRLFRPFVQADESIQRRYGGTGLGLVLCDQLAHLLGGRVHVQSEAGHGSMFELVLPVGGAAARARELTARRLAEVATTTRPVVVCVDDEFAALDVLDRTFSAAGLHAVPSSDAAQAVSLCRQVRPAVITLDVLMPDPDGWALLAALRADPELRRIPVVMVSVNDLGERALAAGAAAYFTKPVDRARLVAVVERLAAERPRETPVLSVRASG